MVVDYRVIILMVVDYDEYIIYYNIKLLYYKSLYVVLVLSADFAFLISSPTSHIHRVPIMGGSICLALGNPIMENVMMACFAVLTSITMRFCGH